MSKLIVGNGKFTPHELAEVITAQMSKDELVDFVADLDAWSGWEFTMLLHDWVSEEMRRFREGDD